MYNCFNKKVVLITAAAGEIGSTSARDFARYGASLAVIDNHEQRMSELLTSLKNLGISNKRIYSMVGDCTNEKDIDSFVEGAALKFGQIDILVNVTGTKRMKSLETCTLDDVEFCMNGNLKALFLIVKKTSKHLIKSQGSIVHLSSVSGQRPAWAALPYCSIKAGCDQFIKCIATELALKGVRVNAVSPAAVKSEFMMRCGNIFTSRDQLERYVEIANNSIPMGRTGTIQEVANIVLYLASDKSPFMAGTIVPMCGAYSNTSYCPA